MVNKVKYGLLVGRLAPVRGYEILNIIHYLFILHRCLNKTFRKFCNSLKNSNKLTNSKVNRSKKSNNSCLKKTVLKNSKISHRCLILNHL